MPIAFLLIHSPLVGPYTWIPASQELESKGYRTIVPSLLPALDRGSQYVRAIADGVAREVEQLGINEPLWLVGHSAAGSFLPAIRAALKTPKRIAGYLFVDARLPKNNASLFEDSSPEAVDRQRQMARAGWLPPWSEWFGEDAIREVIPDDKERKRFVEELRPIPLALFEEPIPVFAGWPDAPCVYIRLSEFYKPQAEYASSAGWQVRELNAQHMHMLCDPHLVTEVMLEIVAKFKQPR